MTKKNQGFFGFFPSASRSKSRPNKASQNASRPSVRKNVFWIPKKDAKTGKALPDEIEGTVVRVSLFNQCERAVLVRDNPSPATHDLQELMAKKLNMTPESNKFFSIWIEGKDLELQLRPKLDLFEVQSKWFRWMEKYTHASKNSLESRLIYKREAMTTVEDEKRCKDLVAIRLLYGEARKNVLSGRYPVSVDDATRLAAWQLQLNYGDYSVRKHGHSTSFVAQSIPGIVPEYVYRHVRANELEAKIIQHWASPDYRLPEVEAYHAFLDICREMPTYGATFFPACKNVPPSGYFERRTDHLLIGVSPYHLSIVDMDKFKISWATTYDNLLWECTPDSITFFPQNTDVATAKSQDILLLTPQAHLVDSLASRAVYLIRRRARRELKMRDKRTTSPPALNDYQIDSVDEEANKNSALPEVLIEESESQDNLPGGVKNDEESNVDYLKAVQESRRASGSSLL